ncbi:restriction endonuclease [Nesterenkonia sp. CL21]|uniref:McrC family protein n=1 Tax=Nesterenkonia sp. CL21 TaxID=3064894 RepID=UPI00287A6528|nr:restriction endonuclease [Nesterenkonia sp. CL21]MDS2171340.1 restriction endonuclease [Nesterenkonia sp. CL21]
METLHLTEGAPPVTWELPDEIAQALADSGIVEIAPAGHGQWRVAAGRKIGVARVREVQLAITPKVRIDRLVFMMGYAQAPDFWRDHTVAVDVEQDLPEALAEAFGRLATRALEQGLLHGYREVEETLPVMRGRIRVGDQISRRYGRNLPLEVRYDEFSADIPENRLLLAATVQLLRMGVSATARRRLQRLRLQLADVTLPPRGTGMPAWRPSRLNVRYQPALHLAELVLAGQSFEHRTGDLQVSGFLFDMWRIYEDFVGVAMREALGAFGGESSLQHRLHLDEARTVAMRPDFVWTRGGVPALVADMKYKAEKPTGFPNADLYQLLAYCTVMGLREGHLIYAQGAEDPAIHDIAGADVQIHAHALDLDQPPKALVEQVEGLAMRLVRGVVGLAKHHETPTTT